MISELAQLLSEKQSSYYKNDYHKNKFSNNNNVSRTNIIRLPKSIVNKYNIKNYEVISVSSIDSFLNSILYSNLGEIGKGELVAVLKDRLLLDLETENQYASLIEKEIMNGTGTLSINTKKYLANFFDCNLIFIDSYSVNCVFSETEFQDCIHKVTLVFFESDHEIYYPVKINNDFLLKHSKNNFITELCVYQ